MTLSVQEMAERVMDAILGRGEWTGTPGSAAEEQALARADAILSTVTTGMRDVPEADVAWLASLFDAEGAVHMERLSTT